MKVKGSNRLNWGLFFTEHRNSEVEVNGRNMSLKKILLKQN